MSAEPASAAARIAPAAPAASGCSVAGAQVRHGVGNGCPLSATLSFRAAGPGGHAGRASRATRLRAPAGPRRSPPAGTPGRWRRGRDRRLHRLGREDRLPAGRSRRERSGRVGVFAATAPRPRPRIPAAVRSGTARWAMHAPPGDPALPVHRRRGVRAGSRMPLDRDAPTVSPPSLRAGAVGAERRAVRPTRTRIVRATAGASPCRDRSRPRGRGDTARDSPGSAVAAPSADRLGPPAGIRHTGLDPTSRPGHAATDPSPGPGRHPAERRTDGRDRSLAWTRHRRPPPARRHGRPRPCPPPARPGAFPSRGGLRRGWTLGLRRRRGTRFPRRMFPRLSTAGEGAQADSISISSSRAARPRCALRMIRRWRIFFSQRASCSVCRRCATRSASSKAS